MKNRWSSSRGPTRSRRSNICPEFNKFSRCAKSTWKTASGMFTLCHRGGVEVCLGGGGVVHSVPHTAGLNMKPHYCKLPQFTLSKGAKMDKTTTKKDSFNFWETSHGLIKLSTCTYHKLYPLCVLMKCYTVLWSVVLLSVRFFFLLWVLPDACRSVIVRDTDFDCCVHRRERSRSGRGGS